MLSLTVPLKNTVCSVDVCSFALFLYVIELISRWNQSSNFCSDSALILQARSTRIRDLRIERLYDRPALMFQEHGLAFWVIFTPPPIIREEEVERNGTRPESTRQRFVMPKTIFRAIFRNAIAACLLCNWPWEKKDLIPADCFISVRSHQGPAISSCGQMHLLINDHKALPQATQQPVGKLLDVVVLKWLMFSRGAT